MSNPEDIIEEIMDEAPKKRGRKPKAKKEPKIVIEAEDTGMDIEEAEYTPAGDVPADVEAAIEQGRATYRGIQIDVEGDVMTVTFGRCVECSNVNVPAREVKRIIERVWRTGQSGRPGVSV